MSHSGTPDPNKASRRCVQFPAHTDCRAPILAVRNAGESSFIDGPINTKLSNWAVAGDRGDVASQDYPFGEICNPIVHVRLARQRGA
jgi:hypothetical protein